MRPITFCIPTANNEKEYIHLLLKSIKENTNIDIHEILVFIDSDNQNTFESLMNIRNEFPNLRIHRNTTGFPVGTQTNSSIMFNEAKNEIVCYLQSDMVVGPEFDKHIIEAFDSGHKFICGTRIEPPIHPPSPDKFVENFGLDVNDFDYDKFMNFSKKIQSENRQFTVNYSVPFAIQKDIWFDIIGGYDTQFRCSHEDIDSVVRLQLAEILPIQSWKMIAYHFTCVSSRGIDWYKSTESSMYKNELQQLASHEESKRFIRKWGTLDRDVSEFYEIGLSIVLDRYVDMNFLKQVEPFCSVLALSNQFVIDQLKSQIRYDSHYYSNLKWQYTPEHWESVCHLFNQNDFDKRIVMTDELKTDIILSCKYSDMIANKQESLMLLQNIQKIISETENGVYEYGNFLITVKNKQNKITQNIKNKNMEQLLNSNEFRFV